MGKNRRGLKRRSDDRQIISARYAAPVPPPAWLEHYERVHPGAANRMFAQWESQTAHRQQLEASVVSANILSERLGMCFAFILALAVLAIAWRLFELDRNAEAFTVLVGEIATLVWAFRFGRRMQASEREQKRRAEVEHPMLPFGEDAS